MNGNHGRLLNEREIGETRVFAAVNQAGGSGGVTDHGALTGLSDDDHTQYAMAEGSGTRRAYEAGRLNRTVTAGVGLSGGGILTSDITISMGLPSTLTADTINSVTGTTHTHDIVTGLPSTIQPDHTALEGASSSLARADHQHGINANAPTTNLSATTTNAEGTSTSFTRADHTHAVTWSSSPSLGTSFILGVDTSGTLDLLGDFSIDFDTLFADVSEHAVYINATQLPTRRGALTVRSNVDSQMSLVIEARASQTAHLLRIYDFLGDDLILLNNVGDLESGNPNFVSGMVGWQITHDGNAEFNNLVARGELHVSVFVADEMHASGGTLALLTAFKVSDPNAPNDNTMDVIGNTFVLVIQASYATGLAYVAVDDILRLKFMGENAASTSLDLWDVYVEVESVTSNSDRDMANGIPGTFDVVVTRRSGGETGLEIPKGTGGVVWGHINQTTGGIILTSDLSLSPYIDIFTNEGATPWTGTGLKPRVRMGNLDGVLSLTEQWGFAASSDLSDDTVPHVILSDQQLTLKGVHQFWWDNSGNLRGEVDPTATGGSSLFWLGPSESDKKLDVTSAGDVLLRGSLVIGPNIGYHIGDGFLYLPFDGPEPYDKDFQINLQSHTGFTPETYVSIIGKEGKFGKAAQVARNIVNLVPYPSFEVGSPPTGWTVGGTWATNARSVRHKFGDYSQLLVINAPGSTSSLNCNLSTTIDLALDYIISGYVWISSFTTGAIRLRLQETSPSFVTLAEVDAITAGVPMNGWYRIWAKYTGHGGATELVSARVQILGFASAIWTAYWDAIQVEQSDHVTPYADGSMGIGHSWSGTEHESSTTRSAGNFYYRYTDMNYDTTDGARKGTIAFWVYADDWEYPGTSARFLWADNASNANFDMYIRPTFLVARANGSTQLSHSGTIPTGEWIHVALTWNVFVGSENALYLNGQRVALGTGWPIVTLGTVLRIGTSNSGGGHVDGFIDDFILLLEPLSADDIEKIYESQAPLQVSSNNFELMMTGYGKGKVFGHAGGLFGEQTDGTASFALLNADLSSWGGFSSLGAGDLIMGHNKSGSVAMFWDKSAGTLGFYSNAYTSSADLLFSSGGDIVAHRWGIIGNYQTSPTSTFMYLGGTTSTSLVKGIALGGSTLANADFYMSTSLSPSDTMNGTIRLRKPGTGTGYGSYLTIEAEEADTGSGIIYLLGNVIVATSLGSLPTGGAQGRGTINAKAVYDDGGILTDFVFEDDYALMPIDEMAEFMYERKHLPTIPGREEWEREGKFSLGKITNHLWETVEAQAIYIHQLHTRIEELERTIQ